MFPKYISGLFVLSTAVMAAPQTGPPVDYNPPSFKLVSYKLNNPGIQYGRVEAYDSSLVINPAFPSAKCPPQTVERGACGQTTGYKMDKAKGILELDVAVPGGQQMFVKKDGLVSFTPWAKREFPQGAITDGWVLGNRDGVYYPLTHKQGGFLACYEPSYPGNKEKLYRIYVAVPGCTKKNDKSCVPFELKVLEARTGSITGNYYF